MGKKAVLRKIHHQTIIIYCAQGWFLNQWVLLCSIQTADSVEKIYENAAVQCGDQTPDGLGNVEILKNQQHFLASGLRCQETTAASSTQLQCPHSVRINSRHSESGDTFLESCAYFGNRVLSKEQTGHM